MRQTAKKMLLSSSKRLSVLIFFMLFICTCQDDMDRQETIVKLRSLGVKQEPPVAKPGDIVTLTFHLAGPQKMSITASPALDSAARYSQAIMVTPVDQSPSETEVGPLSLYTYRANYVVPSDPLTLAAIQTKNFTRIRYNVRFSAKNGDEESIVGDSLVYAAGAPQLNWIAPTISIKKPLESSQAGTIELEGAIESVGNETNKVAWFVSAGKVKNRKAKQTRWEEAPSGAHALFFTVRGAKSGAFAIRAQAVNIN